jgi:tetratricopeptide (TPR) repeat protein
MMRAIMSSLTLDQALDRGLRAQSARDFAAAEQAYREALSIAPNDPETNSLLGLVFAQAGRLEEGVALLQRAVELDPDESALQMNLAGGLAEAQRWRDAQQVLLALIERWPVQGPAWTRLGDACLALDEREAALMAWRRAHELDVDAVEPARKLATLARETGQREEAIAVLEQTLSLRPTEPALLAVLCDLLVDQRAWGRLQATAQAWAGGERNEPLPWYFIAQSLFEQGRHREAVQAFANYLSLGAHGVADLAAFAGLCLHAHDYAGAEAALAAAREIDAHHPEVLAKSALLYMYFGRFEQAKEACLACLEREPLHVPVHTLLSRLSQGALSTESLQRMEQVTTNTLAPFDLRIPAAFAVAHAFDAMDDIDSAFAAYVRAHELSAERDRLEGRAYDRALVEARTRRLMEIDWGAPLTGAAGESRPIFIVGMPRSGTTLIEAMLGAHPQVQANGELLGMQALLAQFETEDRAGRHIDAGGLQAMAAHYRAELPQAMGKSHVTDKHPLNFLAVGLILTLFPNAVILHARRDPLETGLSIFRQEFSKRWAFTHQLEDIAHFYAEYVTLMNHWEQRFPGRIITVQYEDFAGSFAEAAPSLVQACGLPWDSRCLDFAGAPQAIATFSTVEVRRPVSVRRGRAERYAAHLEPLRRALLAAGVDLQTGGSASA